MVYIRNTAANFYTTIEDFALITFTNLNEDKRTLFRKTKL